MSYWCRSRFGQCAALAILGASGLASAQQFYVQPQAQVGGEADTNRNLITSGDKVDQNSKRRAAGYDVDASAVFGYATPTTDTLIKPDVAFSEFPSLDTNDLRTALDVNSQLHTARGQGSILGQFDRESTYSSELANPEFNQIAPGLPNTPETGRVSSNTTRTLVTAVPTYTFDLTQRVNWGFNGTFQDVSYSGDNASSYIPYRYYQGGSSVGYAYDQRLSGAAGLFVSHEAGSNGSGQVNAYGLNLSADYKLSSQFTQHLLVSFERDDSAVKPSNSNSTVPETRSLSTGVGATYVLDWTGQIQKVELSAGRTYTPNGNGGTFAANQFQLQYQRDLSQRMQFLGAVRYLDEISVSRVFASDNFTYANASTSLKWKLTPTWYVTGGLEYVYESFSSTAGNARNGSVFIAVGYQGLGKRT